jgi:hypothetical protein
LQPDLARKLELVEILDKHGVIRDGIHVFEIGSGGAHAKYINDFNPTVRLSANDLYKDANRKKWTVNSFKSELLRTQDTVNLMRELLPLSRSICWWRRIT